MLRYEVTAPRATVTIDDPERRNPLSNDLMLEMAGLIRRAGEDDDVAVIVITGAGDRAFSAGGDLTGGFVDRPLADHGARGALAGLLMEMEGVGKPLVARVNGHALAGGLGVAAACDIVIAADHATFGVPEVKIGLWPMMISAVLVRVMPYRAALELMLTGRRIDAAEAMALGLVSRVVPASDLDAAVDETVDALAALSPAVVRLGRTAFKAIADMDLETALEHLHGGLTAVAMTDDAAEGVAAFLEKREPRWSGR